MIRDTLLSALMIIFLIVGLVFSGCAKKPADTVSAKEGAIEQKESVLKEKPCDREESVLKEMSYTDNHVVRPGECLWWIAQYKDVYNDPFQWPIIYDANSNLINNPDLIYPGQIFSIPRKGYSINEVKEARKRAGAPRPYAPPEEAFILTE